MYIYVHINMYTYMNFRPKQRISIQRKKGDSLIKMNVVTLENGVENVLDELNMVASSQVESISIFKISFEQ